MFEELLKQIEDCESSINYEEHREKYLDKLVHSYPVLDLNTELKLFNLYKTTGDRTYKDIIFKCHLRDVYDSCKDATSYRSDLISEGIVLLCEFIDNFDYTMPYTRFSNQLKTRLVLLYKSKINENNRSLNTEMSTQDLIEHENNGECLTDTDEVKLIREQPKEELIIVLNEGLEIVPNRREYLVNRKERHEIFSKIFKPNRYIKKLVVKYPRDYYPDNDMDF